MQYNSVLFRVSINLEAQTTILHVPITIGQHDPNKSPYDTFGRWQRSIDPKGPFSEFFKFRMWIFRSVCLMICCTRES